MYKDIKTITEYYVLLTDVSASVGNTSGVPACWANEELLYKKGE